MVTLLWPGRFTARSIETIAGILLNIDQNGIGSMPIGRHNNFRLSAALQRERQRDIDLIESEKRPLRSRVLHWNASSMNAEANARTCPSNSAAE